MVKLNNFLGQALLAFLPALIVALISHHNLAMSGKFSFSFAIIGVCFSIFYMGQRAYIGINGVVKSSLKNETRFRDLNVFFATLLSLIICMYLDIGFWLALCAISIKLSESPIELHNGVDMKYRGVKVASKNLFKFSFIRAVFIIFPLFFFSIYDPMSIEYLSIYFVGLSVIVWCYFWRRERNYEFGNARIKFGYFFNFNRLKIFAFSTIACSLLSALPRLSTSTEGIENHILLIALSISPAIAVVFQAVWLTNIGKLNKQSFSSIALFYFEILIILVVLYFSSPIWSELIPIFYGVSVLSDINIFKETIIVMSVFFGAMTLMNCFKFYNPKLEMTAYIFASVTLLISVYFDSELFDSIYYSTVIMLLFSSFPLLYLLKKELNK